MIAINKDEIKLDKSHFILYSNKQSKSGLVNEYDSATTIDEAQAAINNTKELMNDIKKDNDLWKYYNYVINENEKKFISILIKFNLQIGNGASFYEVERELKRILISESNLPFLCEELSGWLFKEIMEKIAKKQPAIIYRESFEKKCKILFDRFRCKELIDFAVQNIPSQGDIQKQIQIKPYYLRQLESIECETDEIIEAVDRINKMLHK